MTLERERLVLTLVWFAGWLISCGAALSYLLVVDESRVPLLLWPDVASLLKNVLTVYGAYLGGIVVFWFAKPFKPRRGTRGRRIRFWIALTGAVIVNGSYVAWLLIGHWNPGARLSDILEARNIVLWLSFIVAPANLYFFGVRADLRA